MLKGIGSVIVFSFLMIGGGATAQCDDCAYSCCNVYGNCAASSAVCYCKPSTCRNQCCVDERCGSDTECSTSSTLAIIIVLISIFSMCVFCFAVCLCLTRMRRKNTLRNRIRNDDRGEGGSGDVMAMTSQKNMIGVPIENVCLGQPVDFPNDVQGMAIEGQPIKTGRE